MKFACYSLDSMIRSGKTRDEIHDFLVSETPALLSITERNSTGFYGYIYGEYMDGTDWVPDDDYVAIDRPWYTGARANLGRVTVVDPYIDAQTNTVMITLSKTLCDTKSVAAMDLSIEPLQVASEEIAAQGGSTKEIVLDRKYQVIAHSDRSQIGHNYLSESGTFGNALVDRMRASGENFFSFKFDGSEYIVYTVSVSNDWTCISVSDATSTFAQLKYTLIFTIG